MAGPTDLYELAEDLLFVVVDALDTIPDYDAELDGAPERQFVSPGPPVADFVGRDCCSQVAVWALPTVEADTTPSGLDAGRRSGRYAWINHVGLSASVSRCIPMGSGDISGYTPPTPEQLNFASRQHLADGRALWNHLHEAVHAGQLLTLCDEVIFDSIIPAIPSGGCAGWVVSLRAALGGYTETLGS
jgi:hypothetical protein